MTPLASWHRSLKAYSPKTGLGQAIKVARLGIPRGFSAEELRRKPAAFAALSQALAKAESDPALLRGHEAALNAASFSPDGTRIVTTSDDNTARLWDATNGRLLGTLQGHTSVATAAAFSPDGMRIVTASDDNTVALWDAASGRLLTRLRGHRFGHGRIVLARRIEDVRASDDDTARLWDAASGRLLATLQGHTISVTAASFSPDGTRIVTTSYDKTARLWDATTGRPLATLQGHTDEVKAASFSPDGRRIVTASGPHRTGIAKADIRERLRLVWTDPLSLDPSKKSAKVTREVAEQLADLAKSLDGPGISPKLSLTS